MIHPTILRSILLTLALLFSSLLSAIVIENRSPYAITISLWAQLPTGTPHVQVFTETIAACTDSTSPPKIIKNITSLYRALAIKKCHSLWDGTLNLRLIFINVPSPGGSRNRETSLYFIEPNRYEQTLKDRGFAGGGADAMAEKRFGYDNLQPWDLARTKVSLDDYKPEGGTPSFTMKPRSADDRGDHTALLPPVGYEPPRLVRTRTHETASTEGISPSSEAPTPRLGTPHATNLVYFRTPHSPRFAEAAGGAGALAAEAAPPTSWGPLMLSSHLTKSPSRAVPGLGAPHHHAPLELASIHEAGGSLGHVAPLGTASPDSLRGSLHALNSALAQTLRIPPDSPAHTILPSWTKP